jgi:hypothetical protein
MLNEDLLSISSMFDARVFHFWLQNFKPKSQLRSFWCQNFVRKMHAKTIDEIDTWTSTRKMLPLSKAPATIMEPCDSQAANSSL